MNRKEYATIWMAFMAFFLNMRDGLGPWLFVVFVVVATIAGVIIIVLFATLPAAAFGWLLLAFGNLFGLGVDYGYWDCFIAGLGTAMIVGLIVYIKHG